MLKLNRKKERYMILSIIYRISKIIPFSLKFKFIFFSNLSWIFNRLAFETSNQLVNTEHVSKTESVFFFKNYINKNDRILDIGCGSGEKSFLISKYCKELVGIDYSNELINMAKIKYSNFKNMIFLNMDLHNLKSSKEINYYDVVFLSHVLEHVENTSKFLKLVRNLGDKILIEVPDFDSNILNLFRKNENLGINYTDDDHVYEFDTKSLIETLHNNEYEVTAIENRHGVIRIVAHKK